MLSNLVNITNPLRLIPIIAVTGFIDGIHPCAIAILIFFIAFLLTLKKSFKNILFLGSVYILVIFLTYLGIGVGFFSGMMIFGRHHFFAELGSVLLIILGFSNVKNYFFPGLNLRFSLPSVPHDKVKAYLRKATLPTVIIAAFLIGVCSVPCSGGIYAAITALLASKTTYLTGFLYLLIYNLMFVFPLIIILFLATNPYSLVKLGEWQQKYKRVQGLVMGIFMIVIGVVFLMFFV